MAIDIKLHLQTIGMPGHRLAMAELKPLSGIGRSERETFWSVWTTIEPRRRAEIAHAMVDLAEDNVDLDFGEALLWMLDDEDAAVRSSAIDGLWEQDNTRVLRRLLTMLRSDPAPEVRTAVALTLSRFANLAGLEERAHQLELALSPFTVEIQRAPDVRIGGGVGKRSVTGGSDPHQPGFVNNAHTDCLARAPVSALAPFFARLPLLLVSEAVERGVMNHVDDNDFFYFYLLLYASSS